MKKSTVILTILFAGIFSAMMNNAKGSMLGGGKQKVVIQTSAQCESCQKRIETALKKIDGIKSADLNLDNKKVTVVYDPAVITIEKIKVAISNTGYDADDVKADSTAYENLPGCCKKGGHD